VAVACFLIALMSDKQVLGLPLLLWFAFYLSTGLIHFKQQPFK
jgi:hypothetical protein